MQDYSRKVQKAINRIQSFDEVKKVHEWAHHLGYDSISHDLVFGLPFQSLQDVENTIDLTCQLNPDRLSFYSYAHVPWVKGVGQRGFDDKDIPKGELKRNFYERGKELLEVHDYHEIGMDHFAKPTDSLYHAFKNKDLHRNFMGYTTNQTKMMIGLGMSSISDSWFGFAQNVKSVEGYIKQVQECKIPVFRGHILSDEDLVIRQHILDLMCHFETELSNVSIDYTEIKHKLFQFVEDGLVEICGNTILVKDFGKMFIRNICMCFDLHLHRNKPDTQLFSTTI